MSAAPPSAYLVEVFTRLPGAQTEEDLQALLPWHQADSLAVRFADV